MAAAFQYRHRSEIDRDSWDAVADASDEAWMWHRGDFIDAQLTWPGRHDFSFGAFDAQGNLRAVMPVVSAGGRTAGVVPHRYMRSAGLACAPGLAPAQRRELYEFVAQHLHDLLDTEDAEHLGVAVSPLAPFVRPPNTPCVNPLLAIGLGNEGVETWMVDLGPAPEKICSRYNDGPKKALKRARRAPYTIREASGGRDLEAYYALHRETYGRSGHEPEPFEFYRIIFERFVPAGRARIVVLERDGVIVAGHNTAIYKEAGHSWTSASVAEPQGANHVLIDDQIMKARELGFAVFEVGEAFVNRGDPKDRGISEYKRSFGAELRPFYAGRLRSQRLKHRLYRAVRELAGREP